MATLLVTIGSQSSSKTISNADITRLLEAAKKRYGQVTDAGVLRDRTNAEVFDLVVGEFHTALKSIVLSEEARVASQAIVSIALT